MLPHQVAVLEKTRGNLERIHRVTRGAIVPVANLFSDLAKDLIPPPVACELLGVKPEPGATCSLEQLLEAFGKNVDADDDASRIEIIVAQHAASHEVMSVLAGTFMELHQKTGGDFGKLKAYLDSCSEAPIPEEMVRGLFGLGPEDKVISDRAWMNGIAQSIDPLDTADKLKPGLDKYIATL